MWNRKKWGLLACSVVFILIWICYVENYQGYICLPDHTQAIGLSDLKLPAPNSTHVSNSPNKSATKDILLFSYMRSGSSVTGRLLRDSPGTFFMFEPISLLAPYSYFTDGAVCRMRDVECSSENAEIHIKVALDTLVNMYSCDMRTVPEAVIYRLAEENKSGEVWKEFARCMKGTFSSEAKLRRTMSCGRYGYNASMHGKCYDNLEEACREADVRVAKVLRLSFTKVHTLLEKLPNLNVLFLVRDPRAIMNSRIQTEWFPVSADKPDTVLNNILSLCLKMSTDIKTWKYINGHYETRILHTTLQKLSSHINMMLKLFELMNKTVTLADKRNIYDYINVNLQNNITEKWRTELAPQYQGQVEEHCYSVIQHIHIVNGVHT